MAPGTLIKLAFSILPPVVNNLVNQLFKKRASEVSKTKLSERVEIWVRERRDKLSAENVRAVVQRVLRELDIIATDSRDIRVTTTGYRATSQDNTELSAEARLERLRAAIEARRRLVLADSEEEHQATTVQQEEEAAEEETSEEETAEEEAAEEEAAEEEAAEEEAAEEEAAEEEAAEEQPTAQEILNELQTRIRLRRLDADSD